MRIRNILRHRWKNLRQALERPKGEKYSDPDGNLDKSLPCHCIVKVRGKGQELKGNLGLSSYYTRHASRQ